MATPETRTERFLLTAGAVVVVGAAGYGVYRLLHKPAPPAVTSPVPPPATLPTTWRGVPITRPGGTVWLELTGSAPTTATVWVAEYTNGVLVKTYPQKGWPASEPWVGGSGTIASPVTPPPTLPSAWRGAPITRPRGTVWLELTGPYPAPRTTVVWVAQYVNGVLSKVYPQKGWPASLPWVGGYARPKTPTGGGTSAGSGTSGGTGGTPTSGGGSSATSSSGSAPTAPATLPSTWRGYPITRPLGTVWLELTGSAPTLAPVWVAEYQNGTWVRTYPQDGWAAPLPWTGGYRATTGSPSGGTTGNPSGSSGGTPTPSAPSAPATLPTTWRGYAITRPLGTVWLELTGAFPTTASVWVAEYSDGRWVKTYPQQGWPASQPWVGGYAATTGR